VVSLILFVFAGREFISQFLEAKESVDVGETGEKMAKLREDVESLVPVRCPIAHEAGPKMDSLDGIHLHLLTHFSPCFFFFVFYVD
jgi:hypothetical protein